MIEIANFEREQVEGYLSSKYNIPINGIFEGEHPYKFFSFKEDADSVKVVFDAKRVPSKAEPFGFVNKVRPMHGVDVGSAPGYSATSVNFTVTTTSDPRDWIELLTVATIII